MEKKKKKGKKVHFAKGVPMPQQMWVGNQRGWKGISELTEGYFVSVSKYDNTLSCVVLTVLHWGLEWSEKKPLGILTNISLQK